MARFAPPPLLLPIALLLAACSGGEEPPTPTHLAAETTAAPLPSPAAGASGVTGMPEEPGPGDVPLAGAPPPTAPRLAADANFGLPPLEDNPETGLLDGGPQATRIAPPPEDEPGIEDAIAVVRAYYAAIDAGEFARAYALWSDGGRSSGQTPEQFAAGLADIDGIQLRTGTPGEVEGAAGTRRLSLPISVSALQRDGSVRQYTGYYVLRRAVVDGADAEQRAWRIASAQLQPAADP